MLERFRGVVTGEMTLGRLDSCCSSKAIMGLAEDVSGIIAGAADRGAPVVAATEAMDTRGAPVTRGSNGGGSALFFCLPTAYLG